MTWKATTFVCLRSYPAEIAYSGSPNRQLSNGRRLMQLHGRNVVVPSMHAWFVVGSLSKMTLFNFLKSISKACSSWSDLIEYSTFESRIFVLRPILLKSAFLAQLIENYPAAYSLWSCVEEKLSYMLRASNFSLRPNLFSIVFGECV